MKKYFSLLALAAMTAAVSFTSCNEDDDVPELEPVQTSDGVFIVCGGNKSGGIEGSLTYYDYATAKASQGVYQAANGEGLGATPNHAVVYGSKIYIVGDGEKTIFVADRNTLQKVANITVEVNGEKAQPRQAVAGNGCVYVSTYSNAVIAIDTLNYTIKQTFDSGYYSEGMAIDGNYLYVANSNYGKGYQGDTYPSISGIDLRTGKTQTLTHEKINNPVDVKLVNGHLFFLDSGSYDADWNQTGAGVYELVQGEVKKCADATEMAVGNGKIFIINAPYTNPTTTPTYKVYDVATDKLTDFCNGEDIEYPGKVSIDATKEYVYITSYHIGSSGYADYKGNGYCVIYDMAGNKLGDFDCGVGAGYVIPNTNTK